MSGPSIADKLFAGLSRRKEFEDAGTNADADQYYNLSVSSSLGVLRVLATSNNASENEVFAVENKYKSTTLIQKT